MATLDINDTLARIISVGKAAMSGIGHPADGVPYFYHTQETFPYFTVRMSNMDSAGYGASAQTEEMDSDIYSFVLRLVIGHVTEGYVGEREDLLYDAIPAVKLALNESGDLRAVGYTTAARYLVSARCINCSGYRIFENRGIAALQVGTEWTIQCEFNENLDQDYL